jgi:Transposase DDE domain group 1
VLIRADSGSGTYEFLTWLTARGRRLAYSIGFTITEDITGAIGKVPAAAWTPAYDGGGEVRDDAWVADITLDLSAWPAGMGVIVRKERPHPGVQLRLTDIDGHRSTCLSPAPRAASSLTWNCGPGGARCEDRTAKDTGLRNFPLHGFAQKQIWCEIVALACELLAWTQMLAFTGPARRWEPRRLRLRIFAVAGRLVRGSRRLRLGRRWPWAAE